jgi:hypothetical protein
MERYGDRVFVPAAFFSHSNGVIMVYDNSTAQSTTTHGSGDTKSFNSHRDVRRVVVMKDLNPIIGMSGGEQPWVQFLLHWSDMEARHERHHFSAGLRNQAPTDLAGFGKGPNVLWKDRKLAVAKPVKVDPEDLRFEILGEIGRGGFGPVYKALDIDNGDHFALKRAQWPDNKANDPDDMELDHPDAAK